MHLQILKVLILSYRWKRFRIPGGRLFGTRPVEEDDDQLDDYGSDSSDETNQEIDSDDHFDFSNCDTSAQSKVQAFAAKTCGCALGDNGDPCSSTTKIEVIFDCPETTLRYFPRPNSMSQQHLAFGKATKVRRD